MTLPTPLKPDQLYTICHPADLKASAKEAVADVTDSFAQDRALDAIRVGTGIKRDGYNIFAYGTPGTGKHAHVRRHLQKTAATMPVPPDWRYVHNFVEQHKPNALKLPSGRGSMFIVLWWRSTALQTRPRRLKPRLRLPAGWMRS